MSEKRPSGPPHIAHEWESLTEREQAEVRDWFRLDRASTEAARKEQRVRSCPLCLGKGLVKVTQANGDETVVPCYPACNAGSESSC